MKIIGAIGYVDKVGIITNLAKVLNYAGKTVLVIDATSEKRYKYAIPALAGSRKDVCN